MRRTLVLMVAIAVGILAAPLGAGAQAGKVWRIGFLDSLPPTTPDLARIVNAFIEGLREHGYVEGRNFVFERRYTEGRADRWQELRSEEHTSELQSRPHLVCRLLLEKKK